MRLCAFDDCDIHVFISKFRENSSKNKEFANQKKAAIEKRKERFEKNKQFMIKICGFEKLFSSRHLKNGENCSIMYLVSFLQKFADYIQHVNYNRVF